MHKKILTLDQLAKFCFENKMFQFDADDSGYKLCVQIPSICNFEEESNDSMLYGLVKLLHTNSNRNRSNVTKEAAEKCMSSIKYKPVLANFFVDEDGNETDFTSHDMELKEDGSIKYIERQVGCFTSDEPYMEYEKEKDRYYIYAKVAIPKEYSSAAKIIEDKGGTKVSAELFINKMSYDAKNNELLLEDIEVMAVTLLGKRQEDGEEVQEGMQGARLDIADFSAKEISTDEKLIGMMEKLLSHFDDIESKEGGQNQVKFEELLQKYEKTVDDITFEYSEMTDEELEAKFEEVFGEVKKSDDEPTATPAEDEEESKVEEEPTSESNEEEETESNEEEEDSDAEDFECDDEDKKKYSVEFKDYKKEFAVSLSDKQMAIESLVNDTYCETDNDYFSVDVYEDDKTVVMHGWCSGKHYRQSYKVKKDVYSLTGDRVQVFAQFLTEDEIAKLDSMKANYAVISEKLDKYESEPKKVEILESAKYNYVAETKEFEELKKEENHFDLSIEDVETKANEILLSYAEQGKLQFAAAPIEQKQVNCKTIAIPAPTKKSRYGGLVAKKEN